MFSPVAPTRILAGLLPRVGLNAGLLIMLFAAGVVPVYAQTLAAPVVSPAGGAYVGPQTVTVTAVPEATVHYTLNGSDPTGASAIYTAPLSVTSTTTLRVRAFRTDWSPSATVTETYAITPDTTAPTIEAMVVPSPNAAGWNRTPVTVSFHCADNGAVATCSEAVTRSAAGANQVVTGTVTDAAGHSATASVTLNLDLTPPVAALTAPAAGHEVTTATIGVMGPSPTRCPVSRRCCAAVSRAR